MISLINTLSVVLTLTYIFIVLLFIKGWLKIPYFHPSAFKGTTNVSVVISARNEEHTIEDLINDLLAQDYPKSLTEFIIVDDHSTDRTAEIISKYQVEGISLISLNENSTINSYKKKAIETAIAHSSGTLIVTTDADCRIGKQWLSTIVEYYERHKNVMISSPVAYSNEKNWFEKCQALEFSYLVGLGAAMIGNRAPITSNGANLAYERNAFYVVGGFKGIDHLASGDDELLLHKMASQFNNNIGFLKSTSAIVTTQAKPSLSEFIQQRKRWASKSTSYQKKFFIYQNIAIWVFNVSILANVLIGAFFKIEFLLVAIMQVFLKCFVELVFLFFVCSFFKKNKLLVYGGLTSVLHVAYMVYIGVAGNSGKYQWKGRKVN